MSETKVIPLELRALICSHLLANHSKSYLDCFDMSPYDRHRLADGVVPLDIPDVRKTQRRVAALLGKDPVELLLTKPSDRHRNGASLHQDSEVHSIRRLLGDGATKRNRRHAVRMPLAPQNSSLGFDNGIGDNNVYSKNYSDDDGGEGEGEGFDDDVNDTSKEGDGLFDTSIFHNDTDPNGFKLPSVFARVSPPGGPGSLNRRHDRVIPTVSERTFVDSNLRGVGYHTDRYDSSGSNGHYNNHNNNNNHTNRQSRPHDRITATSTFLPPLHPHRRDFVSMKMESKGDNNGEPLDGYTGSLRRPSKSRESSSRGSEGVDMTSSLLGMMTLESELTRAGSLLMDENFVPMSVTITKLAQDETEATSLTDNRRQQVSPTSLPEVTKGKTRNNKNKSTNISNRRTNTNGNTNKNETKYCTCKDPTPLLIPSTSPCPCCLRTGDQHETGCPEKGSHDGRRQAEATLACNLCGKYISNRKRKEKNGGKRSKVVAINSPSPGSGYARNPRTPETAINRFPGAADPHHSKTNCSSATVSGKSNEELERMSSKNRNTDPSTTTEHHVRFDDNVRTRHIYPDGDEGEDELIENESNRMKLPENRDEIQRNTKKSGQKKLFDKRHELSGRHVNRIPNLGVSVHAMAYDLALKDARIMAGSRKNGRRRGQGGGSVHGDVSNGTIFSYFPLLKRPLSENDKMDIGVKTQVARKVKAKNYMKHIFGKVKMADYYPGGEKWREV